MGRKRKEETTKVGKVETKIPRDRKGPEQKPRPAKGGSAAAAPRAVAAFTPPERVEKRVFPDGKVVEGTRKPKRMATVASGDTELARHQAVFGVYFCLGPERSAETLVAELRRKTADGDLPESYRIDLETALCWEKAFAWKSRAADMEKRLRNKLDGIAIERAAQNIANARLVVHTDLTRIRKMQEEDEGFTLVRNAADFERMVKLDAWLGDKALEGAELADRAGQAEGIAARAAAGGVDRELAREILRKLQDEAG
jgi:hypothetical protein